MKNTLAALTVSLLFVGNAYAFNISAYCQKVGEAVGGSYQIESMCREQESAAKSNIASMSIPKRTAKYCQEVGQAVGGSYQIMESCIQQELDAKGRL